MVHENETTTEIKNYPYSLKVDMFWLYIETDNTIVLKTYWLWLLTILRNSDENLLTKRICTSAALLAFQFLCAYIAAILEIKLFAQMQMIFSNVQYLVIFSTLETMFYFQLKFLWIKISFHAFFKTILNLLIYIF